MKGYSSPDYTLEKCEEAFTSKLSATKREGMDNVIKWLTKHSDFMTAPASTQYHESRKGGLLRHSLNVYGNLVQLYAHAITDKKVVYTEGVENSIAIISLLHDVCKADLYEQGFRNVPEDTVDASGKTVRTWHKVPFFKKKDDAMYYAAGHDHGYDSVIKLQQLGLKLNKAEIQAIAFHMGNFENKATGKAYEQNPLAVLLHIADLMATYMDEVEDTQSKKEG